MLFRSGPVASALLDAMRSLRSFEEDEDEADAAYEQALREPVPEGSEWGLTKQAMPPAQAEEPVLADERWDGLDRRVHSIEGALAHSRLPNIEAWLGRLDDRVAVVEERLRALQRRLGLVYGAIDMRRTAEGEHVFLEVNPAGQWLFVEERCGLPISQSVAGFLARAADAARPARHGRTAPPARTRTHSPHASTATSPG